ncbi:dynamin-related protein 4C [Tanacetum coccineum]
MCLQKQIKVSEDIVTTVTTSLDSDYVCVRNCLRGAAYQVSQNRELDLFKTHHLLSKIDICMVGTPVLAQKVVKNQFVLETASRCLYRIVKKINEDLNMCALKHSKLQQHFTTTSEAVPIFVQVVKTSSKSFSKITISREFDDFPYDTQMHYFKRLLEIFRAFSQELKNNLVTT